MVCLLHHHSAATGSDTKFTDTRLRQQGRCVGPKKGQLHALRHEWGFRSEPPPQLGEPRRRFPVRFERRQGHTAEAAFAVDEDALVVAKDAELVGFQFVFLGLGVVHVALAGAETPRAFHDALLADEIGGLNGVAFVGGAEDDPVAKIQREDFLFVRAEWRDE